MSLQLLALDSAMISAELMGTACGRLMDHAAAALHDAAALPWADLSTLPADLLKAALGLTFAWNVAAALSGACDQEWDQLPTEAHAAAPLGVARLLPCWAVAACLVVLRHGLGADTGLPLGLAGPVVIVPDLPCLEVGDLVPIVAMLPAVQLGRMLLLRRRRE